MKLRFDKLKKIPVTFSIDKVKNDKKIGAVLVLHLFIFDFKISINKQVYE